MTLEPVANKPLLSPQDMTAAIPYAIPHIVLRAPSQQGRDRPLYLANDTFVRVEQFASRVLASAGWSVVKGDDAHLFFSVLSCNFKDSFFRQVCRNWVGASAEERIARIDAMVATSLDAGKPHERLVEETEDLLLNYYATYPPKRVVHSAMARHVRNMDESLLLRLIAFYRSSGYTTAGAPDLFAASGSSFWFVEVKSLNDSLSAIQYEYFEGYLTSVAQNIVVMRVIPEGVSFPRR